MVSLVVFSIITMETKSETTTLDTSMCAHALEDLKRWPQNLVTFEGVPVMLYTERESGMDGKMWAQYYVTNRPEIQLPDLHGPFRRISSTGVIRSSISFSNNLLTLLFTL